MPKRLAIALCLFLLTLLGAPGPGLSQERSSAISELDGVWNRGRCVGPNSGCTAVGPDHPALTARAKAFRAAFDEVAAPKYDCWPTPIPHLFTDPYLFEIRQLVDRVILTYEKDDVVRTVWLEGHAHPEPSVNEFFTSGYSTGRYERNQLIVETTRFAFDPAGLDSDFNVPSSTQKRVTERYSLDGDRLRREVRTEDPVFLVEPIEFVVESERSDNPLTLPWNCDSEAAQEILSVFPSKYPEDPPVVRER